LTPNHRRPTVESLEARVLFSTAALPRPDHVVVLLEEDHSYNELFGTPQFPLEIWPVLAPGPVAQAPYLAGLAQSGAVFTNAHSIGTHNIIDYNAIFSGFLPKGTDKPPFTAPNIASELNAAGLSFGGYSEGLPHTGYTGGGVGLYTRAHNPWVDFANVPASENLPFTKFRSYAALPTVSYVVPNEDDNMHSGQIYEADNWYHNNIAPYAAWAMKHNSLLIVTWDESHQGDDQIPVIFFGPMVKPGKYTQHITQSNILRTLEDMYGLAPTGRSAQTPPITNIFKTSATSARKQPRHPTPPAKAHIKREAPRG